MGVTRTAGRGPDVAEEKLVAEVRGKDLGSLKAVLRIAP